MLGLFRKKAPVSAMAITSPEPLPSTRTWWYWSTLTRIIDGDTVVVNVDCGFNIHYQTIVRLLGINAPEVHGPTKEAGDAATAYLATLVAPDSALVIHTEQDKDDKYGRLLAELFLPGDPVSLNQKMVNTGHAVPYMVS
jgi:endonuclease YncB( thermonuclease family)